MNALTAIVSKNMKTDSRIIAEKFGKRHDDIIKRIRNSMEDLPADFNARNFAAVEYIDPKGESRPMYEMTRDGFSILVMGFTGAAAMAWKVRFIEAFNAMEQELRGGRGQHIADRSIAEKLAMIREARMIYGADGAKDLWSAMGLPEIVSKNNAMRDNFRKTLRQRIIDILKESDGETMRVIAHRLRRTSRKDDVEKAMNALMADGDVRTRDVKPARGPSSRKYFLA